MPEIAEYGFLDLEDLKTWIEPFLDGFVEPEFGSPQDSEEWVLFFHLFRRREHSRWRIIHFVLPVRWEGDPPKPNTRVRVSVRKDKSATILGVSMNPLGKATVTHNVATEHFFGIVRDDSQLDVRFFGI